MLKVDKINVCYGLFQALWDVSFEVQKGEIVSFLGSNGAGKTTAIKTVQGMLRASSGEILFMDTFIDRLDSHNIVGLGLSLVAEERLLFPSMSVLENLELGAYSQRARAVRRQTLEWIYDLFPVLKKCSKQKAYTLSGGEQQMVAIGRGLMAKPKLLMMDEPSLGLAPLFVGQLFKAIEMIHKQGVSILVAEQNVNISLRISKKAYVFENGRVILKGGALDLLQNERIKKAYLGL
jgi:branched-chain amino acid transport system ATP-binding protein